MRRSIRNVALLISLLGTGTFLSLANIAAGADAKVEADAKKAAKEAMDEKWLGADFKGAKGLLEKAIKSCGGDKCGNAVMGDLHRDLGVVLISMKDTKGGAKEFEAAFAANGAVLISKDYLDNADVKKAWEAAKKGAVAPAPTPTPTPTPTTAPTPSSTKPHVAADAEGNLTVAVKMAPIGYPLPIVVDVPDGSDVEHIKLSFKTVSMEKYKTIEAKKDGKVWVVRVDCTDTQFVGEIKFYVRGYDADKNEVDHFGTVKKPGFIKLVDKLPDDVEAPTFPGGKEPEKCVEKGDCQPGFPCDKGANKKPEGSGCEGDDECQDGLSCVYNDNGTKWCHESGAPKVDPKKSTRPKIFVGADFQADFLYIGGGENICKENTWACTYNGVDVGVRDTVDASGNVTGVDLNPDAAGKTSGGPALGTMRLMVSGDYLVTPQIGIGLRVGFAFNGNPTVNAKFMPFHGEGRFSYFLKPVDGTTGLKAYGLVSAGFAEFDAAVPNIVAVAALESNNVDDCNGQKCLRGIKAYRLAGMGFLGLGGGIWYFVTPKVALNAGLKLIFPIPTFSLGIAPELGVKIGF